MPLTPLHNVTPTIESLPMQHRTGKAVFLKMECYQPAASFKIRGIGRLCQEYVEQGVSHLISSSGGNAGYAVAFAGRRLGINVTVIVPDTTPGEVQRRIEAEGAAVVVHGSVWDEAHAYALDLCNEVHGAYIPPFDHPTLWKGHATIVDELVRQCPKPDTVVLAVGGGGLLCGIVEGLSNHGWDTVSVVAVETEGAASFAGAVTAGQLVTLQGIDSVATSLGAKRVAARALELSKRHTIIPLTVSDRAAVSACRQFADDHRTLVEPACGAALAAVYEKSDTLAWADSIVVIVCGGIGVSIGKLAEWEHRLRPTPV